MTVTTLDTSTKMPIPVERVLDGARDLQEVLVIGWDKDGELYGASSTGEVGELLELIERFKFKLLHGDYTSD